MIIDIIKYLWKYLSNASETIALKFNLLEYHELFKEE